MTIEVKGKRVQLFWIMYVIFTNSSIRELAACSHVSIFLVSIVSNWRTNNRKIIKVEYTVLCNSLSHHTLHTVDITKTIAKICTKVYPIRYLLMSSASIPTYSQPKTLCQCLYGNILKAFQCIQHFWTGFNSSLNRILSTEKTCFNLKAFHGANFLITFDTRSSNRVFQSLRGQPGLVLKIAWN